MRFSLLFFGLVLLLLCIALHPVSAFTVGNMVIHPVSGPVAPRSPVTVEYTIHFDSFMTGTTFESQHTLDMYTELEGAQWVATLTNIDEDTGNIVTPLPNKVGARYRIDGWTLSYPRSQLDLAVKVQGTAPNVATTQDKTIIRIQELDAGANVVRGDGKTVKYQVAVPTPTQTAATRPPTPAPASSLATPVVVTTPTVKQTYSAGPHPFTVIGLLGVLAVLPAFRNRNR